MTTTPTTPAPSAWWRWLPPAALTAVFLVFLGHQSQNGQVFSRYSPAFFRLLLTTGVWAGVSWWVALGRERSLRLAALARGLPLCSLAVLALGLLVLLDLAWDMAPFIAAAPLVAAGAMVLAAVLPHRVVRVSEGMVEWIRRGALVAGACLAGLVITEGVFRLVLLEPRVPSTPQGFQRLIASSWPRSVSPEKQPGAVRILGLSDSFGRAGGKENYLYALEGLLREEGAAVEVVNFSLSGYEPLDQLLLLRRFGARYRPDLVLHGFFVGNDFTSVERPLVGWRGIIMRPLTGIISYRPRNLMLPHWVRRYLMVLAHRWRGEKARTGRGDGVLFIPASPLPRVALASASLLHLSTQLKAAPLVGVAATSEAAPPKPTVAPVGTFSPGEFLRIEHERLNVCLREPAPQARWRETMAVLSEIREETERLGARYVMVIHPDQFQVEQALLGQINEHYGLDRSRYDLEMPQRFLAEYCAAENIPCLDLLPAFRRHGAGGSLYLPRDTHYNREGNRLVAALIHEFLRERELTSF